MRILQHPHPSLRKKCVHVKDFDSRLRKQLQQMKRLLSKYGSVGLSAPQVDIPFRFFITRIPNTALIKTFINPKILIKEGLINNVQEGCLSLPGISKTVFRRRRVVVQYQDERGDLRTADLSEYDAIIFQHEYDHLSGKLIIDYI